MAEGDDNQTDIKKHIEGSQSEVKGKATTGKDPSH